jgi:hypothetical protein
MWVFVHVSAALKKRLCSWPQRHLQDRFNDNRERQSNFSPRTPKHQGKPRSTRDQRARRINKIENPAQSAKPPSPVQIRAAPPKIIQDSRRQARRVLQFVAIVPGLPLVRHRVIERCQSLASVPLVRTRGTVPAAGGCSLPYPPADRLVHLSQVAHCRSSCTSKRPLRSGTTGA